MVSVRLIECVDVSQIEFASKFKLAPIDLSNTQIDGSHPISNRFRHPRDSTLRGYGIVGRLCNGLTYPATKSTAKCHSIGYCRTDVLERNDNNAGFIKPKGFSLRCDFYIVNQNNRTLSYACVIGSLSSSIRALFSSVGSPFRFRQAISHVAGLLEHRNQLNDSYGCQRSEIGRASCRERV